MTESKNNSGFSIASSWGIVVVACPGLHKNCRLRNYIEKNANLAKMIVGPDTDVMTLRTLGTTQQIASKTPTIYSSAKKICDFCMQAMAKKVNQK